MHYSVASGCLNVGRRGAAHPYTRAPTVKAVIRTELNALLVLGLLRSRDYDARTRLLVPSSWERLDLGFHPIDVRSRGRRHESGTLPEDSSITRPMRVHPRNEIIPASHGRGAGPRSPHQ